MYRYRYQLTPHGRKLLLERGIATHPKDAPASSGWDGSGAGLQRWCRICAECPEPADGVKLHLLVMAEDEDGQPTHTMWVCDKCCKPSGIESLIWTGEPPAVTEIYPDTDPAVIADALVAKTRRTRT